MSDFMIVRPFAVEPGTEFSRASVATYYDADGILQTAQIDEPRYSYNPETLALEGLLVEGESTNNILYSEDFSNAAWIKNASTISANAVTAPDGTLTADKVIETTATSTHNVTQSGSAAVVGQTYRRKAFIRAGERQYAFIGINNAVAGGAFLSVDLNTGALSVATGSPINYISTPLPNGWFLIEFEAIATAASSVQLDIRASYDGNWANRSYTGDGVSGIYVWGAHDNEGSYIKTEGSAVTRAADIQGDGLTTNVAEDDYDEWLVGTTYDLGDRVVIISGGSPEAEVHNVYESLIDSNTGNDPLDDTQWPNGTPTNWILVGSTNRWKMFDARNSSQTVNADSIDVALKVARRPNSLFFGNVECSEIQITQTNSSGTIVYQETFQMIESSGEPSYYGWFFQQIQRKTDLFISDLPPVAGSTISIRIINEGGDAKCGTCLVGYAEIFGQTQLGAEVGIIDFSVKRQNDFGDYEILERAYSREGRFPVFVENAAIDRMQNLLAERRATPTLYIAASEYSCTFIYGFYEDMNNVIQYNEYSLFSIRAIGLT